MKRVKIIHYQCEICNHIYGDKKLALSCETKKVSKDLGAKVGDKIKVLVGQGTGQEGIVDKISIVDKYWGHYQWEAYWHTVAVTAKLDDGGYRFLTFDTYQLVKNS